MSGSDSLEGFYAAYMTGTDGNGVFVLALVNGQIAGADPFGVCLSGTYAKSSNGRYRANISVTAPPGGALIQGVNTGDSVLSYDLNLQLPENLEEPEFVEVQTPLGPVNVRFKKLRGLS